MRERGYVEGQTILIDYRWVAAGQTERLNDLAVELVRLSVDLIVAFNTPAAQAAKRATTAIPIVFSAATPWAPAWSRAWRARAGTSRGSGASQLGGKCLELLRELLPTMTHVAALVHATDPFARPFLEDIESAAQSVGVRIQPVVVQGAEEFDGAFTAMVHEGAGAVIIQPILATSRVAALAVQHHLPAISPTPTFAEAGGLMTMLPIVRSPAGPRDIRGQILKGAKPADLPVERPMKFDLVINLKTVKALGLTIPPALLFQADKVIQ